MKRAAEYRAIALKFAAKARAEGSFESSSQWEHLARCYLRLAEQADQNSLTDIAVEFGPKLMPVSLSEMIRQFGCFTVYSAPLALAGAR